MPSLVHIDGKVVDESAARVPVTDRGFLYGDSVYEVTRTSGGRPVDLERHLERLDASARAIAIEPPPRATVTAAIVDTLAAAANPESYVRVIVTRGGGDIGLDPALADRPRLVVMVRPIALPPARLYETGCHVELVELVRNDRRALDPAVKSGNYLNNVMAVAEAKRRGAYEALLCNAAGHVVEGSTSNVFLVSRGVVRTPALGDGLLAGITRRRVLELARAEGLETREDFVLPGDLVAADELFITSSVRGILPVGRLGDRTMSPGPITRRLLARYDAFLADVAAGRIS